ncbi:MULTISPECIES: 50S ribosomal protein L11 methyltransferase [Eubacterium]|uniref:Ribosomal protein L11 methyltransferase n=1 Tax=Eubacterium barkeri TaxID=1528 RepID=A0A1H3BAR0_EUBBA|nr:50S ribosomal protein L11 methyltransferase [Eubacterium barkeri]SDX39013.1 [LSU ribosomal protein L11P]-lysine N-methyltransferase [Eubacterium barkeri]
MIWYEVQIKTTLEAEEAIAELFYEAGAKGVVIESAENLLLVQEDPTVNYIDERLLTMDPDTSIISGYFSEELNLDECTHQLFTGIKKLPEYGLDPGACEVSITELLEEDWANSWKKYYKPTKVGKNIVIKPTWEPYEPGEDDIVVNMDPGMAFGTGTHETTQLCVAAMEQVIKPENIVFDIGCGTGILSIVAAELGCKHIIGIDLDPVAVKVARENLALNKVDDAIEIREGNLVEVLEPDERADVIVANILAEAIVELSAAITPFLKPGGAFVSSGIIADRLEMVLEALKDNAFEVESIDTMGEWNSIIARKQVVQ